MFDRTLRLPKKQSFFLWGPRQVGKTTLLRKLFPRAHWFDLLKSDIYQRCLTWPSTLREDILANPSIKQVVIDEVQKIPALLDEVHWLIENKGLSFALCGSSSRKITRKDVNLLGGRALRYELYGLTALEIGKDLDLKRLLNYGYLPSIYLHTHPKKALKAYVYNYLIEEIVQEAIVKRLPAFSQFLEKAALSDTEMINLSNFARECGVSSHTVREYFEILCDTLMGCWVYGYKSKPKRRTIHKPKFYLTDVGVVNCLAKRFFIESGSPLWGKAFENWIFHELLCLNRYQDIFEDIFYWRLASGIEVDFIIDDMRIAIEAKAVSYIHKDHLKGLRRLAQEHKIKHKIVVCMESRKRKTEDGILILPYHSFIQELENLLKD